MGLLSGIARACLYEDMMLFVSLQADVIRSRYGFVIWNSQGLSRDHQSTVPGKKFGNFRENFIFANSIKRHISDVKNSRIRQDLPLSINDRVILPFREGFIFTKLRICEAYAKFRENKVLAKISEFTVILIIRAATCDFQQCGVLTSVDSDEPFQPPYKLTDA